MTEQWRDVPGYEGLYKVSEEGQLRSLRRDRVMKGSPDDMGYLTASLSRDGGYQTKKIHTLVALAFLGPRPERSQVRHLDDVKTNNAVVNLAYGTASQNQLDRVRNGIHSGILKTHCPRGHLYDEANTYVGTRNDRNCRACRRTAMAARRLTQRQQKTRQARQEPHM